MKYSNKNNNYNLSFQILKKWCEQNDLNIILKPKIENFVLFENIFINKNLSYKHKFFILMHEIGHFINIKNNLENYSKNKKNNKTLILLNEVYAWDKGIELCKSLNIDFLENDFYYYKHKYLTNYLEFISKNE